jgi:hypothetical protein
MNAEPTDYMFLKWVDGRCGSRLRGNHPVAPRPISCRSFVHHLWFRPSSPEALHVKRHEKPLLVKDGRMGEKWPVNLACDPDSHVNHRVPLHATNLRHGTDGFTSLPKEGMLWIFSRSLVPEASTLTTRPSKPLFEMGSMLPGNSGVSLGLTAL